MKGDESIYHHFDRLRHFVPKEPEREVEGRIPPASTPVSDDNGLFTEAMKDVKRLTGGKHRVATTPPPLEPVSVSSPKSDRKMLETVLDENHRINTINLPEYMEGYAEDVNPLTMDKLRNGVFSVQKVLDLHGYRSEDAEALFEEFLEDSIRSNLRCVKVIHGRGLKSKAGPVLKEKLKEWIMRAMHRKWITAFSSAQMREGGPGATNILLKKQPTKKSFRIIG